MRLYSVIFEYIRENLPYMDHIGKMDQHDFEKFNISN